MRLLLFLIRHSINFTALFAPLLAGKWALRLFATPRKGRLRDKDRVFLESAQRGTVTVSGLSVQYYLWERKRGTGPTVLLAHGWESNAARWRNILRLLRENGCSVLALDAPAHGDSGGKQFSAVLYADFIAALMRHIPAEVAVGHSAGGMTIAYFQKNHPGFFKKMVLLGTPHSLKVILNQYAAFLGYAPRVSEAMDAFIESYYGQPVSHFAVTDMAKSIQTPCLIIHDEDDKTAPITGAEQIHAAWKDSKMLRTKGLGHGLQGKVVYEAVKEYVIQ
jgi:pimeloyl-ACP methyl ester carboxylesterase